MADNDIEDRFTSAVKATFESLEVNSHAGSTKLAAPKVLEEGARNTEAVLCSERTRVWQLALLGAVLAALVAGGIYFYIKEWGGKPMLDSNKIDRR